MSVKLTDITDYSMTTNNSRVLNDYVLIDVIEYFPIKDLFRLQRVSKQFSICINQILKLKRQISIGFMDDLSVLTAYSNFICVRDGTYRLIDLKAFNRDGIDSVVNRSIDSHDLSESIVTLTLIADKCQRIQCLALKDCYVEDIMFKTMDEELTHLRCLSLIHCCFPELYVSEYLRNRSLGQRLIHLSVESMDVKDVIVPQTSALIIHWIQWLTNLERLCIAVEDLLTMKNVLKYLPESITTLIFRTSDPTIVLINIPTSMSVFYMKKNLSQLKRLFLENYYISKEFLRVINDNLLLVRFGFKCFHIDLRTFNDLAQKQTELTHLYILWSRFLSHQSVDTPHKFKNLRILELHDSLFDVQAFEHIISSVPNLKYIVYTYPRFKCDRTDSDSVRSKNCKTCQNRCFDFLPTAIKLSRITINFSLINQSFVESLHRFPKLKLLDLTNYWGGTETPSQVEEYDSYLRQIIEIAIEICERNPKKLFRLKVCKTNRNIKQKLPKVLPKNLLIQMRNET